VSRAIVIGLVGDHDPSIVAHRAIPIALARAAEWFGVDLRFEWSGTETITSPSLVSVFDGLWCVPGSPYRSMDGALRAIRHARERGVPFLGTCGGFQHAVIEYARNVLGWDQAEHAESSPEAPHAVISQLDCSLIDVSEPLHLAAGSRLAAAYGAEHVTEEYHCSFGLNPAFQAELVAGPLRAAAITERGDVRAVELDGHPFFLAMLCQPERAALGGVIPPLVAAFVAGCAQAAGVAPSASPARSAASPSPATG
jgi:CTP synthase (UTP-ammonia lyase)